MRTVYFECNMGAAGDMLMSALLELHPDAERFIERFNNIGIPNVKVERTNVVKCGISAAGVRVLVNGVEEEDIIHEKHHAHNHEHEHHEHHHTGMKEIKNIINNLNVSDKIKTDIISVYNLIAEAEGQAHGKEIDQIHFHEVGSMDAVADIAGVCMLIDELKPDKIYTSYINVGYGHVKCAHGILPVPAPATAYILKDVPIYSGNVEGELCTPTGAALLKYFTDEFVDNISLKTVDIGCGMGKRHFYDSDGVEILSAVRVMLSENDDMRDKVITLSCNIDDMTGEEIGFAVERLMDKGALDVFTMPVYMKKNRPGVLLTLICRENNKQEMAEMIFKYTSTIGIRETSSARYILDRKEEVVQTSSGDVRVKKASGFGVSKGKAEYEDLKKIALEKDIAVRDVKVDFDI